MTAPVIRLGRLSPARAERIFQRAQQAQVTYDHVGSTLGPDRHPGREPRRYDRQIGTGPAAFDAGCQALRRWVPQRGIGARIYPEGTPVSLGTTVVILLPMGPVTIAAPNRIVAVIDEPRAFGFAYGTLPGHPESGEESFVIRQDPDGTVTATVAVDAGPGHLIVRLGTPVVAALQRRAIRGYLDAVAAASREPRH